MRKQHIEKAALEIAEPVIQKFLRQRRYPEIIGPRELTHVIEDVDRRLASSNGHSKYYAGKDVVYAVLQGSEVLKKRYRFTSSLPSIGRYIQFFERVDGNYR